jgi:spore maturation protein CgeB
MNKREKHLETVYKIKEKVKEAKHIDDFQKEIILNKLNEWMQDEKAVSLIPSLLMQWYEKDIKPILDELGLTD